MRVGQLVYPAYKWNMNILKAESPLWVKEKIDRLGRPVIVDGFYKFQQLMNFRKAHLGLFSRVQDRLGNGARGLTAN